MTNRYRDKLTKLILTLPAEDILLMELITERTVQQLDRMDKLTDKEENLVNVAVCIAFLQMREEQKK